MNTKNKKTEIDDLLDFVPVETQQSYERSNLIEVGKTLARLNEEYKQSDMLSHRIVISKKGLAVFLVIFAVYALSVVLIANNIISPNWSIVPISALCACFSCTIYIGRWGNKIIKEAKETASKIAPLLESFRETVEGVGPIWTTSSESHRRILVKNALVASAIQVLRSEDALEGIKTNGTLLVDDIVSLCGWVKTHRAGFETMWASASKFDGFITYTKASVFAEAKARITK